MCENKNCKKIKNFIFFRIGVRKNWKKNKFKKFNNYFSPFRWWSTSRWCPPWSCWASSWPPSSPPWATWLAPHGCLPDLRRFKIVGNELILFLGQIVWKFVEAGHPGVWVEAEPDHFRHHFVDLCCGRDLIIFFLNFFN